MLQNGLSSQSTLQEYFARVELLEMHLRSFLSLARYRVLLPRAPVSTALDPPVGLHKYQAMSNSMARSRLSMAEPCLLGYLGSVMY